MMRESTNIFRVLIKTLFKAGIITERTKPIYAAWVDMEELRARARRGGRHGRRRPHRRRAARDQRQERQGDQQGAEARAARRQRLSAAELDERRRGTRDGDHRRHRAHGSPRLRDATATRTRSGGGCGASRRCTGAKVPSSSRSGPSRSTRTSARSRSSPTSSCRARASSRPRKDVLERIARGERGPFDAMQTIITMDPPKHRGFRKVASPWFTPQALGRLDDVVRGKRAAPRRPALRRAAGRRGHAATS